MLSKLMQNKGALSGKPFLLFLISQGVSNFGDAFQLMAATSMLVNITGTGLSAAFGLICAPVSSILFSSLAGYLSDVRHEKLLLVIIDLLRGFIAAMFVLKQSIIEIYILIVMLSILDILYNPPKRKMTVNILSPNRLMDGNSLLSGVSGIMFMGGPVIAGLVISNCGTHIAFFINSISFFLSAFIISIIKCRISIPNTVGGIRKASRYTREILAGGFIYCLRSASLRKVVLLGTILSFTTTSLNIAFYPFAFDILKVSGRVWGGMMSVFYGANLIAMMIALLIGQRIQKYHRLIIPILMAVVSMIWFLYSTSSKVCYILAFQLAEGTTLSLLNIILTTQLQTASSKNILGRVAGINDFVNNSGKIFGILCAYLILRSAKPNSVFLFCAFSLFAFAIYNIMVLKDKVNS